MIALVSLLLVAQSRSKLRAPDRVWDAPRVLYQVGSFQALLDGRYDGTEAIGALLRHGDFGLGTFNGLDGEMVILDGTIYHGSSFGDADMLPNDTKTPFAFVTSFAGGTTFEFRVDRPFSSAMIQEQIDRGVFKKDAMLAIRVDGKFRNMTLRAYPPQIKPYLPFLKLKDRASVFPYPEISGTMVGFRLPQRLAGLNVPGYHFHFVDSGRKKAGHVLGYTLVAGTVTVKGIERFVVGGR